MVSMRLRRIGAHNDSPAMTPVQDVSQMAQVKAMQSEDHRSGPPCEQLLLAPPREEQLTVLVSVPLFYKLPETR